MASHEHAAADDTCLTPTTPVVPVPAPLVRFAFVDALRGMAAMCILVFHLWWYEPHPQSALNSTHWTMDQAFLRLRGGVQILLVISGFVIAYTLRKTWFTRSEVISFIGRRLVRLVPAYWVTLLSVILIDEVCERLLHLESPVADPLSFVRIAAHMAFLQDVLNLEAMSAGIWTLCIEMQFYVVAIIGWGLAQRLFSRPDARLPQPSSWGLLTVFAPLAFVSLFHWRGLDSTDPWVIHFLWMFFLGMIVWWTLDRALPRFVLAGVVMIAFVQLLFDAEWRYPNSVALLTALAIFTAGHRERLHVWLNWWPLQYLGRISYSLYLIHFPVCHLLMYAGWKWCDNSPSPMQARCIMLVAIPPSLLAGHLLHVLVEAPSARWAASLKRPAVTA